jgi:hypothetical protein
MSKAINIPSSIIDKIASRAEDLATHSWEHGALSSALLEIYSPFLSPFFGPFKLKKWLGTTALKEARGLNYAKRFIRTDQDTLIDGEGM